jgi:hypothetical protein
MSRVSFYLIFCLRQSIHDKWCTRSDLHVFSTIKAYATIALSFLGGYKHPDSDYSRTGIAPGDEESHQPKRRKVAESCKVCRAKKTRCDGQRPICSPCKTKNIACEYNDVTVAISAGSLANIEARLPELEQQATVAPAQIPITSIVSESSGMSPCLVNRKVSGLNLSAFGQFLLEGSCRFHSRPRLSKNLLIQAPITQISKMSDHLLIT